MSLMLIMPVAAKEKRHVVTADVARAYLNAEMDVQGQPRIHQTRTEGKWTKCDVPTIGESSL